MPIPDYQTVMLPLLQLLADGQDHLKDDYVEPLAGHFGLTDEERQERFTSGTRVLSDRVGWAVTYLKHAGLLESTGRKWIRITESGRQVLAERPSQIDKRYLFRFPAFVEWYRASGASGRKSQVRADRTTGDGGSSAPCETTPSTTAKGSSTAILGDAATPLETLEASYQALRQALAEELLDRIKKSPPAFFERVVIDLLVALGYGGSHQDAAQAVGGSGDDGVDGIIKEANLGLVFAYA
jgi:restriction system protein